MLSFLYDNLLTIMQLVVLFVSIYISFTPHIKRIFVADFVVNVSLLACYVILGDVTTAVMYVCISLRSFVYIYKDRLLRYGWIPWVAIAAQIVLGLATMDNPFQIVSIFIPCWVCWYLWYWHDDKQKIRFGNIVNNGCWGIYNGIVGLWIVVLMRVIVVISNAVSIARTYREEKIQEHADSLQEALHEAPEKETGPLRVKKWMAAELMRESYSSHSSTGVPSLSAWEQASDAGASPLPVSTLYQRKLFCASVNSVSASCR